MYLYVSIARSAEDETQNGHRNAKRNHNWNQETDVLSLFSKFQMKRSKRTVLCCLVVFCVLSVCCLFVMYLGCGMWFEVMYLYVGSGYRDRE